MIRHVTFSNIRDKTNIYSFCNRGVCLSLIRERRRFAPPRQAHATKTNNAENQTERRGGAEPSPLNYSESAAAFTLCNAFLRLDITFRFQSCICVLQQYRSNRQKRIIRTRFQSSYYSLMAERTGFADVSECFFKAL